MAASRRMDAGAEATAAMGGRDLSIGGWPTGRGAFAQLGAAPETVANATGSRAADDDDDAEVDVGLPDWVEVRVEGQVVTAGPGGSRAGSASARPGRVVARRVVVRAGQSWGPPSSPRRRRSRSDPPPRSRGRPRNQEGRFRYVWRRRRGARPMGTVSVRAVASPRDVVVLPRPRPDSDRSNGLAVDPTTGNLVGAYVPSSSGGQSSRRVDVPVSGPGGGVACE